MIFPGSGLLPGPSSQKLGWLGDGAMYKEGRISGTDYMCSGSFQARGAGWHGRQVRLPAELGVGKTGTAEEERCMQRIPSEGPGAVAHLGNAFVFQEEG